MKTRLSLIASVSAATIIASTPQAVAEDLVIVNLGTLPGGTSSFASAINDEGVVAGHANTADGHWHVVRWGRHGRIEHIGRSLPAATSGYAVDVSRDGSVVARVVRLDVPGRTDAARWDADGRLTMLKPLATGAAAEPTDLSEDGSAVGHARTAGGNTHAVRWDRQGRVTDLGTLPDATDSHATAINPRHIIVGFTTHDWARGRALRWNRNSTAEDLGLLPGGTFSRATHVDDAGNAYGSADTADGRELAVRWDTDGHIATLQGLPGDRFHDALTGVSGNGFAVGLVGNGPGNDTGVRWSRQGQVTVLPMLTDGPYLAAQPVSVNDRGTVVGQHMRPDVTIHCSYWTRDGKVHSLPRLSPGGEYFCQPVQINAHGQAIGNSTLLVNGYTENRAVLWRGVD